LLFGLCSDSLILYFKDKVVIGASFFTSVFVQLGCGRVIESSILGLPFGPWGGC
jgi:hypothetical protein